MTVAWVKPAKSEKPQFHGLPGRDQRNSDICSTYCILSYYACNMSLTVWERKHVSEVQGPIVCLVQKRGPSTFLYLNILCSLWFRKHMGLPFCSSIQISGSSWFHPLHMMWQCCFPVSITCMAWTTCLWYHCSMGKILPVQWVFPGSSPGKPHSTSCLPKRHFCYWGILQRRAECGHVGFRGSG